MKIIKVVCVLNPSSPNLTRMGIRSSFADLRNSSPILQARNWVCAVDRGPGNRGPYVSKVFKAIYLDNSNFTHNKCIH